MQSKFSSLPFILALLVLWVLPSMAWAQQDLQGLPRVCQFLAKHTGNEPVKSRRHLWISLFHLPQAVCRQVVECAWLRRDRTSHSRAFQIYTGRKSNECIECAHFPQSMRIGPW